MNDKRERSTMLKPLLKRRTRQAGSGKAVFLLFVGLVGIMGLVFLVAWFKFSNTQFTEPLYPPVMAGARYSPRDVVGDLGGMPVTIPSHFANFVEYEGDPGWSKREGPVPKRNHQSKLVSFGFMVRFPDMQGLSSRELEKDRASFTIRNTPWIDVGITTGKNFGDGLGLERRAEAAVKERMFKFEKQTARQFDLDVYRPIGVDPNTRQPFKHHYDDEDVFIFRDAEGAVLTLINCKNVDHAAAPCVQRFSLDPNLKAWINIIFRRGLLPEWRQMQTSVTTLILGFKKPGDATDAPVIVTQPLDTKPAK